MFWRSNLISIKFYKIVKQSIYSRLNVKKYWRHLPQGDLISFFVTRKSKKSAYPKNPKNQWESIKIADIDRESLYIFWTTWQISMKVSGKMWLMIVLTVTKKQGFNLCLEDTFLEKPQWGSNWTPSIFRVKENCTNFELIINGC